jgi:acyl-CoA dehydrogenase
MWPLGGRYRKPSDRLASEVALSMPVPGAARERLLADAYMPDADSDTLGCGERAFALVPQVQAIEMRLGKAIGDGVLPRMPQSLAEMWRWNIHVMEQGFISVRERVVLDDFAYYGDISVQVDDFSSDFDRSIISQTTPSALLKKRA